MSDVESRPARRRIQLFHEFRMGFLCWSELLATQNLFLIAPALFAIYGNDVDILVAVAGFAVGLIMLLIAWITRRFMTLQIAMWLYLPMAIGYAVMVFLPPFSWAVLILFGVGFSAVQIAYVRAEAPRFARTEEDQRVVLTAISSWVTILQAVVNPVILALALLASPRWVFALVSCVLLGAFASGIRFADNVKRDVSVRPEPWRGAGGRLWRAAAYNFFNAGQIACWLMPMTLLLSKAEFTGPWWPSLITSASAVVGSAFLFAQRWLKLLTPHRRMGIAALIAIMSIGFLVSAHATTGSTFLAALTCGFLLSQASATVGEGAVGDLGTGVQGKSWSGGQQLTLNSMRALGFSTIGWVAVHSVAAESTATGVHVSTLAVAAGLTAVITHGLSNQGERTQKYGNTAVP